jgi:3-methyladenine DNA glycosylase Tag
MGFKTRHITAEVSQPLPSFESAYQRAIARKGGTAALEALLPEPRSRAALARIGDDRYLSGMAKNIFRAGFVWKIVDNKWPSFESAFRAFDVMSVAGMDEQDIDELARDPGVIRNRTKLAAVRDNARFVLEVADQCGSFGRYLGNWPQDDLIGLWADLHRRGSRLGGFTRAVFLREMGVDTFFLTGDVIRALVGAGVVAKKPTSQRDLRATQAAFNAWHAETGRPLCQLSRILAYSVD